MNIKENHDLIVGYINKFRQAKSLPFFRKVIPASYSSFYNQPHITTLESSIQTTNSLISSLPTYLSAKSKKISVISKTFSHSCIIYSNRHHESIMESYSTTGSDILIGMVDKENSYRNMRVQGGGLKKKYIEEQNAGNFWIGSYLDIGRLDGTPTQISTTIVIELPSQAQDLDNKLLSQAINKHLALGVLPVIRFYEFDDSPVIDGAIYEPFVLMPSTGIILLGGISTYEHVEPAVYNLTIRSDNPASNVEI